MKYYSEHLDKIFDSIEQCKAAEDALRAKEEEKKKAEEQKRIEEQKKSEERKEMAHKVEEARKVMTEAQVAYRKILGEFIEKYGSYHYTTKALEEIPHLFYNLFNM